ncbi:hypothetical protein [Methanobrevibacter sp.]|uniref:hypothetical protein n=1 Tax=Methanobrevibacter sp. TaxID=66852 RepID=UPI00386DBB80
MGLFNRFKKNKTVNDKVDYASKFKGAVDNIRFLELYPIFDEWAENDPSDANLYWAGLYLEQLRRVKINGQVAPVLDMETQYKIKKTAETLKPTNKELHEWYKQLHNNVSFEMHRAVNEFAEKYMDEFSP